MDTIIRNVRLANRDVLTDVGIQNGIIAAVEPNMPGKADTEIEGGSRVLTPAFADTHTHLDKAMLADSRECTTLESAIAAFEDYCVNRFSKTDMKRRAGIVLKNAFANGTLYMRTHMQFGAAASMEMLEALVEVKEAFSPLVDLQIIVMAPCYGEPISKTMMQRLRGAAKLPIDGFDAAAHLSPTPEKAVDDVFDLCSEFGLFADFHTDETDDPDIRSLKHICRRMEEDASWKGRVSAGHICALSAVDDGEAAETIARMRQVGLNAIVMASCNLYLMGRTDHQPVRRGITRVKEMQEAGVNVVCASDNIRDYFRPYGNANILEEALITAQAAQLGTPSELRRVFEMGTFNAARVMGIRDYGLDIGCRADLVLLDASDTSQALLGQASKIFVMKNGHIVCSTRHDVQFHASMPA